MVHERRLGVSIRIIFVLFSYLLPVRSEGTSRPYLVSVQHFRLVSTVFSLLFGPFLTSISYLFYTRFPSRFGAFLLPMMHDA